MIKADIQRIVVDGIAAQNRARPEEEQIPVADDTVLFGRDGHLDSMALVTLLLDVEESLLDNDIEVSLSDEKAMSQARSPFRSVASLVDYIESCISEHG